MVKLYEDVESSVLDKVRDMKPIKRIAYWIKERESIRLKREAGKPRPWTLDPILNEYRFCNVRRMDDKVSQWLLANWLKRFANHPLILPIVALGRFINTPDALKEVQGFISKWDGTKKTSLPILTTLQARRARGETVFNAAYIVTGNAAGRSGDKLASVFNCFLQGIIDGKPKIDVSSMEKSVESLLPLSGIASFMAGQIVADLRHTLPGKWSDKHVWAAHGPGSRRGLNRVIGRDVDARWKTDVWNAAFTQYMFDVKKIVPESITSRLEAIDYQNCLCEFDKYSRTLLGEGKPKRKYQ